VKILLFSANCRRQRKRVKHCPVHLPAVSWLLRLSLVLPEHLLKCWHMSPQSVSYVWINRWVRCLYVHHLTTYDCILAHVFVIYGLTSEPGAFFNCHHDFEMAILSRSYNIFSIMTLTLT